jgi:2-alkenal reductase
LGVGIVGDAGVLPVGVAAQNSATPADVASVAATANPGVVTILTMTEVSAIEGPGGFQQVPPQNGGSTQNGEQLVPLGSGSGFIIDEAGHVVTNSHVVASGTAFEVQFYDGTTAMATLVGADPFQDVAVLQLDLEQGQQVPGTVHFGDSDVVRPGDQVVAIGTPFGEYDNTVTSGIINAVERGLDSGGGYSLPNLIQHDAAIYPGNSGGPLLNANGEVIGINVAKAYNQQMGMTGEGFNFAIESNAAREIVDEIIGNGAFDRSYLGIRGQAAADGVQIVSVEAGGPAETAGLQPGDIITGVQGIDGNDPNEALDIILFERRPGDTISLEVLRGGQLVTIDVTLGERPTEIVS